MNRVIASAIALLTCLIWLYHADTGRELIIWMFTSTISYVTLVVALAKLIKQIREDEEKYS